MSKPFNIYQALNAACKRYNLAGKDKKELQDRILKDKPHEKDNNPYKAIMGYAKQLCKELNHRNQGREILKTEESVEIMEQMAKNANEFRKAKVKQSLVSTLIRVASIMDEL